MYLSQKYAVLHTYSQRHNFYVRPRFFVSNSVQGIRFTCRGRERYLYIELLVLEFPIKILDSGIVRCLKATLMLWFAHVVTDHKMLIRVAWRNYGGCLGRGCGSVLYYDRACGSANQLIELKWVGSAHWGVHLRFIFDATGGRNGS